MICKNCGAQILNGETVCRRCGKSVNARENNAVSPDVSYNNSSGDPAFGTMPVYENKVKKAMINRSIESVIVFAVAIIVELIGIILATYNLKEGGILSFLGFIMLLVFVCRYVFFETLRNMRWLDKFGLSEIGADIDPDTKRKWCAGKFAFFLNKRKLLIPYSEILWVYRKEVTTRTRYGSTFSREYMVIKTRNGKTFEIQASPEEFTAIYGKYSESFSKDILIGFTKENAKTYKRLRRTRYN